SQSGRILQISRQTGQHFGEQTAFLTRIHHADEKLVEALGVFDQCLRETVAAFHPRANVPNDVAHDFVGGLLGQRLQALHHGQAGVNHGGQLPRKNDQVGQPDAALPFHRQWRCSRPNSYRPNGSTSLARSFAREVPVVSASALTTYGTIAIGRVALQDSSLRVAGPNCHKSRTVTNENPATDWARHRRRPLGMSGYNPRFIRYFNKSATRWL